MIQHRRLSSSSNLLHTFPKLQSNI